MLYLFSDYNMRLRNDAGFAAEGVPTAGRESGGLPLQTKCEQVQSEA